MIVRAEHNGKTAPYVILSRKLIQEHTLPYGAKCLLLMMLSYPDNWSFNEPYLAEMMDEDIQTIINWLEVLAQNGYIRKHVVVPYGNSYIEVGWLISEYPMGV